MHFSSISFIFFMFPIIFLFYYILSFHRGLQNVWLFLAGIVFYAWGEPIYIILLLFSIMFNWLIGLWIGRRSQRGVFVLGCVYNLGMLFILKYVSPLGESYGIPMTFPLGMSMYTFQAISYLADIYNKKVAPEKNPLYVGLYISFFPKVLIGPLMRYADFSDQIRHRKSTYRKCAIGACRFIVGLGKKVLFAGNLVILSDLIFNYSTMGRENFQVPVLMAWMGLIALVLQIYFDYSGYSDMAIGLGLMFGFRLEENFDYPLSTSSVRDFWKRWNITVMNWFNEYVYIPLGGSKGKNKDSMIKNLFITWILFGLWHGAKGNFILWAVWNFFFILMEYFLYNSIQNCHKWLMHVYTLVVVGSSFVLLRAKDMYQAGQYFMNLLGANYNGVWNGLTGFLLKEYGVFIVLASLFAFPIAKKINQKLVQDKKSILQKVFTYAYPVALFLLFVLSVSYLVRGQLTDFWYLRY